MLFYKRVVVRNAILQTVPGIYFASKKWSCNLKDERNDMICDPLTPRRNVDGMLKQEVGGTEFILQVNIAFGGRGLQHCMMQLSCCADAQMTFLYLTCNIYSAHCRDPSAFYPSRVFLRSPKQGPSKRLSKRDSNPVFKAFLNDFQRVPHPFQGLFKSCDRFF